jgi:hypothetical protein
MTHATHCPNPFGYLRDIDPAALQVMADLAQRGLLKVLPDPDIQSPSPSDCVLRANYLHLAEERVLVSHACTSCHC